MLILVVISAADITNSEVVTLAVIAIPLLKIIAI